MLNAAEERSVKPRGRTPSTHETGSGVWRACVVCGDADEMSVVDDAGRKVGCLAGRTERVRNERIVKSSVWMEVYIEQIRFCVSNVRGVAMWRVFECVRVCVACKERVFLGTINSSPNKQTLAQRRSAV